jgi:hypothetical protein
MKKKILGVLLKVLMKLCLAVGIFFVATFTVYFFNLDMKLTSLVEPFLEKWYDHLERKQYI